ncbi:MAG: DUF2510 domain-containing protein [Ilumatobacteraceae bacterium]
MFTYDVVSESVRNPHELAAELTRRSNEGWEVVQITYDGAAWFHAFIRHAGNVPVAPHPGMKQESATPTITAGPLGDAKPSTITTSPAQPAASTPSVPANWYPDPSKRYELRYWNGTKWTEHVATGGVQSTDQPQ